MARDTMATLRAEIDALRAQLTAAPTAPSEASQHYTARDLPCPFTSHACAKTFRTVKGQAWHLANTADTHKAAKAK